VTCAILDGVERGSLVLSSMAEGKSALRNLRASDTAGLIVRNCIGWTRHGSKERNDDLRIAQYSDLARL